MTELFLHLIHSFIIMISCFLVLKRSDLLIQSPISRLIFIPLFFVTFGFILSVFSNTAMLFQNLLEGYIFFQIVNLSNTSRRTQSILHRVFPNIKGELKDTHNSSRIESLIASGVLEKCGDNFRLNKGYMYKLMLYISKLINLFSFKKY